MRRAVRCASAGGGLDAVAALAGEPEEALGARIEAADRGAVGREGAQARPSDG